MRTRVLNLVTLVRLSNSADDANGSFSEGRFTGARSRPNPGGTPKIVG